MRIFQTAETGNAPKIVQYVPAIESLKLEVKRYAAIAWLHADPERQERRIFVLAAQHARKWRI